MPFPTGELVPARIDYHDIERGWTDQESATTDTLRKTWALEGGKSYIRVQTIGTLTTIFPPMTQPVTEFPVELQQPFHKDPVYGFPAVFYYNA